MVEAFIINITDCNFNPKVNQNKLWDLTTAPPPVLEKWSRRISCKFWQSDLFYFRPLGDATPGWTVLKNNQDKNKEYRKSKYTDNNCPHGKWNWGQESSYPWDYIEKSATCLGE